VRPSPRSKDPVNISPSAVIITVAVSAPKGLLMVKSQIPSAGDELAFVAQDVSAISIVEKKKAE
jgi:hypothetical protein